MYLLDELDENEFPNSIDRDYNLIFILQQVVQAGERAQVPHDARLVQLCAAEGPRGAPGAARGEGRRRRRGRRDARRADERGRDARGRARGGAPPAPVRVRRRRLPAQVQEHERSP